MYMPIPKGTVRKNPMQVRESQKFMFAALNMVLGFFGFAGYGLYTFIQKRSRGDATTAEDRLLEDGSGNRGENNRGLAALRHDAPKRVIIVGASAAGATTAAMITKADPSLEVMVFDENRRVPFTALTPYAQVGHRSYDLSTSGAPDTLSSPTTWTVTRDAKLVPKGISRVFADRNIVVDTDGVEHRYDALVLAVGSSPDINGCNIKGLKEENVDKHRICMSPHVTRDTLQTVWEGNILCVKIATRAFQAGAKGGSSIFPSKQMLEENNQLRSHHSATEATKALAAADVWAANHYSPLLIKRGRIAFDRSCDVSFVSSVNTIWKFLQYFKRLNRMPVSVYCDEASPCKGLGHSDYTATILQFWSSRGVLFHGGQRLVEVDILGGTATFETVETEPVQSVTTPLLAASKVGPPQSTIGQRTTVPFKLLFLDFPRKAPDFISASGLSCKEADGFVAVDPHTLQHVSHKNIFAVGDCAALPTMKSYGAVFAQVPVVAHNVIQYLGLLKRLTPEAQELMNAEKTSSKNKNSKTGSNIPKVIIPPPTATYDGYSSAPVVMTTWRSMWPERRYLKGEVMSTIEAWPPSIEADPSTSEDPRVNYHKWDNTAWSDVRGLLNGMYLQLFGYELMYWFIFLRGHWHPPTWFRPPHYPEGEDLATLVPKS